MLTKDEIVKGISEIMQRYNEKRSLWFKQYKSYEGFDEWFTQQVTKGA